MKDYFFESQLARGHPRDPYAVPKELFSQVNENMPIPTTDVMIHYGSGILLIQREKVPAKGQLFPIGGRMIKGVPTIESLRMRAVMECGLSLEEIAHLGTARHFWDEDPFGHGKGVDTISEMFYACGIGNIKLDKLHSTPTIVVPSGKDLSVLPQDERLNYVSDSKLFRDNLNPWVSDFLDLAMNHLRRKEDFTRMNCSKR